MIRYKKILLLLLFVGATISANAEMFSSPINDTLMSEPQDTLMTLTVTINEDAEVEMKKVPKKGKLEIYNLLGVKITSVDLKKCTDGKCSIELTKGLYILKAGKVAKKVIVR